MDMDAKAHVWTHMIGHTRVDARDWTYGWVTLGDLDARYLTLEEKQPIGKPSKGTKL